MFRKQKKSDQGRTMEQLRHHYEVEKRIADRLRRSSREHRIEIAKTMYAELFAQVPDHPRLTARHDPRREQIVINQQIKLLRRHLYSGDTFIEFGPGNCGLAITLCTMAEYVYVVDIAEMVDPSTQKPDNFEFIVYDGHNLNLPNNCIDVAFSNQMIEHLHPDDTEDHFRLIYRLLKPGGVYVFCTPHKLYGPNDISRYFSDVPQGFHLKEWTFKELTELIKSFGFSQCYGCWHMCGICFRLPNWWTFTIERMISFWPVKIRRRFCRYLLPSVTMVLRK